MSVIINHPRELGTITNILKKQCLASEAKINKEKTQICVIVSRNQRKTEDF